MSAITTSNSATADSGASSASSGIPPLVGPQILLTDKAVAQIKQIQLAEGKEGQNLRVSVVGGGCSGLSYKLAFEDKPVGEKDKVFSRDGVALVVDMKSLLFLKGTELDFTDGLDGRGFVFNNPNAKSSCGCGSSFSA